MDVLQKELDEIRIMWNTHQMRYTRSPRQVTGVPDELYYIPELSGTCTLLYTCYNSADVYYALGNIFFFRVSELCMQC